jgi:hypothetical protein
VRRRAGAGASGTLTSETAIVSASASAGAASATRRRRRVVPDSATGSGAGAGGSTAAAPRRRRVGAAAGAVARARFSRSHRALIRATWSSESGVIWLRTGTSICRRRLITSSTEIPNSPAMSVTRSLLKELPPWIPAARMSSRPSCTFTCKCFDDCGNRRGDSLCETRIRNADHRNSLPACNTAQLRATHRANHRHLSRFEQR